MLQMTAKRSICVVGCLHQATPRPGSEPSGLPRFGAHRAQWDLFTALKAHPAVDLNLADPWLDPRVSAQADWVHNFGQAFESEPYRIRDGKAPLARLSSNHHSLSYPHLVDAAKLLAKHPRADMLIASSVAAKATLKDMVAASAPDWPGDIEVVPLPVSTRPPAEGERHRARAALGLTDACVALVSVGRLSRHDKATLEPLLWLVAELRQQGESIRLFVAGDDTHGYGLELQRQARCLGVAESVELRPDVNDEERDSLLWASDVFVSFFDSGQESFGLAVAEAQGAGLPCVCSEFGSIKEIVDNGVTGFTVPTTFVAADDLVDQWREGLPWRQEHLRFSQLVSVDRRVLLKAVLTLVRSPDLRAQMRIQAASRARLYSPSTVASRYVTLWSRDRTEAGQRDSGTPKAHFSGGKTFGRFATTRTRLRSASWRGRDDVTPAELLDDGLLDELGIVDALPAVVATLASSRAPISAARLCTTLGVDRERVVLSLATLHKYGFVEVCS